MTAETAEILFTESRTGAGVSRYASAQYPAGALELARHLGRTMNVFLSVNFKACGLPLPAGIEEKDDAYAEAPAAVSSKHSLHVFVFESPPGVAETVDAIRQKAGLIMLFTNLDRDALMEELKFYWAWFARPATLRMQFEEGSEFLAEKLLSGLHAVLIEAAPGKGWIVYANPKNTPDWRAVGFPNPPVGGEG
jgi:hypothetical protein